MYGTGNISDNPLFVHTPPTGYFFLSHTATGQASNSPCVDAGDPTAAMIDGSTRTDYVPDTGVVDMGFHWLHPMSEADGADLFDIGVATVVEEMTPTSPAIKVTNHPNPFNNETVISLFIENGGSGEMVITDVSGRIVETLHQGYLESGYHEFTLRGNSLSSGVYFYRAKVDGVIATGKALLVK